MKRSTVWIIIVLLLIGVSYTAFNILRQKASAEEANKTALQLDQVTEKVTTEDLSSYFDGYKGSFVLFDQNRNEYLIYNEEQSQMRASPCSTFKILNSLIGLETNAVEDENTVIKWNGKPSDIQEWNQDHTMASAFANSVVWYYQEVASRVGEEKMDSFLKQVGYGNADSSGGLTKFWLDSSLKISPLEQVVFLRRLYAYDLPFSRENIDIVKKIMVRYDQNGIVLRGKTGYAGRGLGWFVGYLEKDGNVYFFATKVEGKGLPVPAARIITETILKDKKLLDAVTGE